MGIASVAQLESDLKCDTSKNKNAITVPLLFMFLL